MTLEMLLFLMKLKLHFLGLMINSFISFRVKLSGLAYLKVVLSVKAGSLGKMEARGEGGRESNYKADFCN